MKFEYKKKIYRVHLTKHIYDSRYDNGYIRGEYINEKMYLKVVEGALLNGLQSYRGKGVVVITVPDYNKRYYSFLVELNEYDITVISIYRERKRWWMPFIRVTNRINLLRGYVLPKMTDKEKLAHEFNKVDVQVHKNEDNIFLDAMKPIKHIKRNVGVSIKDAKKFKLE